MREKFSSLAYLGIFLGLVLAFNSVAKDKAPKISNIQGRVQMINKDSSTITIEKGSMRRQVVYSGDTKFLYGHSNNNKPGTADQVKEGNCISCSGRFPRFPRPHFCASGFAIQMFPVSSRTGNTSLSRAAAIVVGPSTLVTLSRAR